MIGGDIGILLNGHGEPFDRLFAPTCLLFDHAQKMIGVGAAGGGFKNFPAKRFRLRQQPLLKQLGPFLKGFLNELLQFGVRFAVRPPPLGRRCVINGRLEANVPSPAKTGFR